MFNFFTYNGQYFSQVAETLTNPPQDDIVYNWLGLFNSNYRINRHNFYDGHRVENNTYYNPLIDLGGQFSYFLREKIFFIEWSIKTETNEELLTEIDRLKRTLAQPEKDLDYKYNWTIRRAKASCVNLDRLFRYEHYNITWLPFRIEFNILSQFSQELLRETQTLTWLTADLTEEVVNRWTFKTDPTLVLTFTSATTVDEITFTVGNNTITVEETISASDVVEINGADKEVKINSTAVDFSGTFPVLEVWANSYTITVNWTKNYSSTISFFKNFI